MATEISPQVDCSTKEWSERQLQKTSLEVLPLSLEESENSYEGFERVDLKFLLFEPIKLRSDSPIIFAEWVRALEVPTLLSSREYFERSDNYLERNLEERRRKREEEERRLREEEKRRLRIKCIVSDKILNSRPTLAEIVDKTLPYLGENWHSAGELLEISKEVMREIESKFGNVPKLCLEAMFSRWLNYEEGTGLVNRTWDIVQWAVRGTRMSLLSRPMYGFGSSCLGSKFQEYLDLKAEEALEKETMYEEILNSRPTIAEVENLILYYLGDDWHRVGELLGMSEQVMRKIGSKFVNVPKLCSEAMFSRWLNHEKGTGPKDRTWGTVLTALNDAGRSDVSSKVLDDLVLKRKQEDVLKKAPDITDVKVLVIPWVARLWRVLGRSLGIVRAILSRIEKEVQTSLSSKQKCEMFQLWLEGAEGTGDEKRSWSTIFTILIDIGHSDVVIEVVESVVPQATVKDIAQILSALGPSFASNDDAVADPTSPDTDPTTSTQGDLAAHTSPDTVPATPTQGVGSDDTATLMHPSRSLSELNDVSVQEYTSFQQDVNEQRACCSKSLNISSESEEFTDILSRLKRKRPNKGKLRCLSPQDTEEERTATLYPTQSDDSHMTWCISKRRLLDAGDLAACTSPGTVPTTPIQDAEVDEMCTETEHLHDLKWNEELDLLALRNQLFSYDTAPTMYTQENVSLHDFTEYEVEEKEDRGCCSKSLSESSGSELSTDRLSRLSRKRIFGRREELAQDTVEDMGYSGDRYSRHTSHSGDNGMTWSLPRRRLLEKVSNDVHHKVVRKHWTRCKEGLDCAAIKDQLLDKDLIDFSDKERIEHTSTTCDCNEIVLDRLYKSSTPPRLLEFALLLQEYKPLIFSEHVRIGKEIESSLMEIVENSSPE